MYSATKLFHFSRVKMQNIGFGLIAKWGFFVFFFLSRALKGRVGLDLESGADLITSFSVLLLLFGVRSF